MRRKSLRSYYARRYGRGFWTKPERMVYHLLKELNITFDYQHKIKCRDDDGRMWVFTVDFFIYPDIVIEVDGDRVHGTKRQLQKMEWRDNLLRKHGYRVYHFWQSEIEYDIEYVKNKVVEIVNTGGISNE